MLNREFEAQGGWKDAKGDFFDSFSGNITTVYNVVVAINNGNDYIIGGDLAGGIQVTRTQPGPSDRSILWLPDQWVFQNDEEIVNSPNYQTGSFLPAIGLYAGGRNFLLNTGEYFRILVDKLSEV